MNNREVGEVTPTEARLKAEHWIHQKRPFIMITPTDKGVEYIRYVGDRETLSKEELHRAAIALDVGLLESTETVNPLIKMKWVLKNISQGEQE